MSVYRPKARKPKPGEEAPPAPRFWLYDFRIGGRRFHGSTGQLTRRAAEQFEERIRRSIADGSYEDPRDREAKEEEDFAAKTLDWAAGRWWMDVGRRLRSKATVKLRIKIVLDLIGKDTPIGEIRTATVVAAVQARREQQTRSGKPRANASVNRDVIDTTLRPILRYVDDVHEIGLPRISWKRARLTEDTVVERQEFSAQEIQAWGAACDPLARIFLGMLLSYGPRYGELFFPVDALNMDDPAGPFVMLGRYRGRYGWMPSRKDGSLLKKPLMPEHARVLAALAGRARGGAFETVWVEDVEGALKEVGYWAMYHRLRKAAASAGLKPGRLIHGTRHHHGTAVSRATGNVLLVQRALGHRQVTTTARYAHATEADIRAGIAAASRDNPEAMALALPDPLKIRDLGDENTGT